MKNVGPLVAGLVLAATAIGGGLMFAAGRRTTGADNWVREIRTADGRRWRVARGEMTPFVLFEGYQAPGMDSTTWIERGAFGTIEQAEAYANQLGGSV